MQTQLASELSISSGCSNALVDIGLLRKQILAYYTKLARRVGIGFIQTFISLCKTIVSLADTLHC